MPVTQKTTREVIRRVLKSEGVNKGVAEVSIVFTNDKDIKRLNKKYFRKDSPTDVIAFPIERATKGSSRSKPNILGDIVICIDEARRNALNFKTSTKYEVCLYLVHGILHLLGYDDIRASDRKKMRAREKAILSGCPFIKQRQ